MNNISGYWANNQWYSNAVADGVPLVWAPDKTSAEYHLAYVTEKEIELIKNTEFKEQPGPEGILYFGPPPGNLQVYGAKRATRAPLFWKSNPEHELAWLIYISDSQASILKAADIYKSGIATKDHYGPAGIISYQGTALNPIYGSFVSGIGYGSSTGMTFGQSEVPTDGYTGISSPVPIRANSGVYNGSISAQGNMVAMQLSNGELKKAPEYTEQDPKYVPWLQGYFRTYYEDPKATTFGANTEMPALTGVMPARFTNMQGNFVYYMDLALTRLTGGNWWDNYYFINVLGQSIGYVLVTNDYIRSINSVENNSLEYYGSTNYSGYITAGFDIFTKGKALPEAFKRLGILVRTIPTGYYGTPASIASTMIDYGVGYIQGFTTQLTTAGVDINDIYNPLYTNIIVKALSSITAAEDLKIIQGVLETTVENLTSLLDYLDISKVSKLPNDSGFTSMAEVGKKIYELAPNFDFPDGRSLGIMLENLFNPVTANVNNISTSSNAISPSIIASLRSYLPLSSGNQPITVLNVIGSGSGYLLPQMKAVNDGIAALYASKYGSQLRFIFENISRFSARIPITYQELYVSDAWWDSQRDSYIQQYYNLVRTIYYDTDQNIRFIVDTINNNYEFVCEQLYYEITNYNRANITAGSFADNSILWNFVESLPYYGADSDNLGTDTLIYGLAQPNEGGEAIRSILAQAKNNQMLGAAGVTIRNGTSI